MWQLNGIKLNFIRVSSIEIQYNTSRFLYTTIKADDKYSKIALFAVELPIVMKTLMSDVFQIGFCY